MGAHNLAVIFFCSCVFMLASAQQQQEVKRPRILGVAHMALYVSDMAKARIFYEDFLGYAEPFHLMNKEGTAERIAFVKINEDQYLELFAEKPREEGLQLNHLSSQTDNPQAIHYYLAFKEVKVPATPGT